MATSDSTVIYGDGTFEEHVQELVNYLARDLADDDRTAFIRPFQESLLSSTDASEKQRKTIVLVLGAVKGVGAGNDREIEGFFNLLFAYVLALFTEPEALQEQLTPLIHTVSSAATHTIIKYRILSNLFNLLPARSPLRLQVFHALLSIAASQEDIEMLAVSEAAVGRWISEWEISPEESSKLWKAVADAFVTSGQPEKSYAYLLAYLNSLPPSSPATESAAVDAVATSIRLPSVVDFDSILRSKAIQSIQKHAIFALLQVFVSGDYAQLQTWLTANESQLTQYNLEKSALERKIRLLTIANLGTRNVGKDLPYQTIASALQIQPNEVEAWVIDAIRADLVGGKLSQPSQTLHITRATHHSFQNEDWKVLENRLVSWKTELLGVLDVLISTKQQSRTTGNKARPNDLTENDKGISTTA